MTSIAFYFDPLCPYAWLTSLWARELRRHQPLDIEWKFFSLAEINELDVSRNGPLRICAQARREGGNEEVDLAYLALGRMSHDRRERFETLDELQEFARPALQEVGLDPDLVPRALDNEATLEDVLADHRHAVEEYSAFGVPWILIDGEAPGFFGPVIGERVRGDDAVRLWENFVWASKQPYLFELKRGRAPLTKLQGLSDDFVPAGQPVSGTR
jgi:2-hydroxychromene-2-carboxylate isomerase